jgi:hypothetical protein
MTKWLGRGLATAVMVLAVVGMSAVSAGADGTCYVACSPPTTAPVSTQSGGGSGSRGGQTGNRGGTRAPVTKAAGGAASSASSGSSGGSVRTASQLTEASGGSLPFTGADIEEMTIGGAGALLLGGLLVRRSRNRRRAAA